PEQVNGAWVAEGQWKPQLGTFDTKVAQQAAKQAKKKTQSPISDDSGPPVSTDSSRPTLGPDTSPDTSTAATAPPQTTTTDNDPDRPTLKKPSPSSDGSSSTA